MPTPATAKWPKPKGEDEFEDMVVDFLRLRWKDPHAARNGRRGQRQHGVDIIGRPPWLNGGTAAAQCKNVDSVTLDMVIDEVEKAKRFPGGLGEFLFVAAAERDAALQAAVRQHFNEHPAPFDVTMVFWPDVIADLSSNDTLIRKHWKGFAEASASSNVMAPPRWITRDGVPDSERTECHGEVRVVSTGVQTELFATELLSELARLAQGGSLGPRLTALVKEGVKDPSSPYTYRLAWKPAGNVTEKIELEIEDGGHLSYRWAEF